MNKNNPNYKVSWDAWVEAATIFSRYEEIADIGAEHDIIYAGPVPSDMDTKDRERLKALGWHISDDNDCWVCYP
jgi:hypothetical protein